MIIPERMDFPGKPPRVMIYAKGSPKSIPMLVSIPPARKVNPMEFAASLSVIVYGSSSINTENKVTTIGRMINSADRLAAMTKLVGKGCFFIPAVDSPASIQAGFLANQ